MPISSANAHYSNFPFVSSAVKTSPFLLQPSLLNALTPRDTSKAPISLMIGGSFLIAVLWAISGKPSSSEVRAPKSSTSETGLSILRSATLAGVTGPGLSSSPQSSHFHVDGSPTPGLPSSQPFRSQPPTFNVSGFPSSGLPSFQSPPPQSPPFHASRSTAPGLSSFQPSPVQPSIQLTQSDMQFMRTYLTDNNDQNRDLSSWNKNIANASSTQKKELLQQIWLGNKASWSKPSKSWGNGYWIKETNYFDILKSVISVATKQEKIDIVMNLVKASNKSMPTIIIEGSEMEEWHRKDYSFIDNVLITLLRQDLKKQDFQKSQLKDMAALILNSGYFDGSKRFEDLSKPVNPEFLQLLTPLFVDAQQKQKLETHIKNRERIRKIILEEQKRMRQIANGIRAHR